MMKARRNPQTGVPCTVYALKSTGEDGPRYVGQTTADLDKRLGLHRLAARKGGASPVCRWIREQVEAGHDIEIIPLAKEWSAIWNVTETKFIRAFRAIGVPLLNVARGGGDNEGYEMAYRPTPEHRARMRDSKLGTKHAPETIEKMRDSAIFAGFKRRKYAY